MRSFFLGSVPIDWVQQPQRAAMPGCGSIARSDGKVFTFLRATTLYL